MTNKKMKNKLNLVIAIAIVLVTILSMNSVLGATVSVVPASSSTISGTNTLLNATVDVAPANGYNCTFYFSSPSTANSTASRVNANNITNSSTLSTWTWFNSSIFEDSNDYSLFVQCTNGTPITSTNTAITIDNTVPTAATLSPATNTLVTSSGTQTFTGTVVDRETTSCTYVIGRGGTSTASSDTISGSGTYATTSCTFTKTFTDQNDNGNWYWYITANDGTNTTSANSNILQIQIAPGGGNLLAAQQIQKEVETKKPLAIAGEGDKTALIWGIVILVAIAVIVIIYKRTVKE